MARHTISEAARITGKSRSTIHRHIKCGKISKSMDESGAPVIDTSELQRVYGSLSHRNSAAESQMTQDGTSKDSIVMQAELEALRRENESLRQERDRWASQAESLTRLLTHHGEPRGASWLARLFRRE